MSTGDPYGTLKKILRNISEYIFGLIPAPSLKTVKRLKINVDLIILSL